MLDLPSKIPDCIVLYYVFIKYSMLVIGNGESRKQINLDNISDFKVGCNALYRDYYVRHLVCVDRRMVQEAIEASYNNTSIIYTREDWKHYFKDNKHVRCVPDLPYVSNERWDQPFQWGSGPYAVLLAAKLTHDNTVSLVGFDLYGDSQGKTNNIYKDTKNYNNGDKRAVDPRYWIHQIGKVFECFPKVTFNIYQEPNWELPKAWNYPNVTVDTISNIRYNKV
jgi:hypothetical protein